MGIPRHVDIILPLISVIMWCYRTHSSRLILGHQNGTDEFDHNRSLHRAGTAARLSTGRPSDHREARDFAARRPSPTREGRGTGDRAPEHDASAHSPG